MADKGRNHEDQRCEHDQHAIQTHALDLLRNSPRDSVQEPGARNGFAKRKPAGGEDDDGPEEVVKVLLCEDARAEKEDDGDDGDDAHVAEDAFELVRDAPEHDCEDSDAADEPLHAGEFVLDGADGHNGGAFAGLEGDKEEEPDEEDGDDADGQGDKEPDAPAWLGTHVLEGNDVLGGGDWGGGTADVGGKCDAEDKSFGKGRVRGEVAEERLGELGLCGLRWIL